MTDHKKTSEVEILKHENHLLQQQDLVGKMLEIEEKRIASLDKKTETAKLYILKSDEADQRQFNFQMQRLQNQDVAGKRKHNLAKIIIIGGGLTTVVFLGVLVWFAFNGSETQSANATKFFEILFTAVGGYGLFAGITSTIQKLLNKDAK